MISYPRFIVSANEATSADKANNILSISAASFDFNIFIWLLASTTPIGSINTVAPLAEVSCTRPGTSLRCSAFTGTTNLSDRIVTIASCKYF